MSASELMTLWLVVSILALCIIEARALGRRLR